MVTLEHPQVGDAYRRTTLTVVRDRAGQPLYLFAQCQDVTPQRIAELELRHSEQRFRLMVDAVRDYAIFMLDTEGHVTSWNLGAQRTKGWTADEIDRPALPGLLPARAAGGPAPRARARRRAARRGLPGGGVAGPQGRQPVLGPRHHHEDHRRGRRPHRLRQGHPRPHRADGDAGAAGAVRRRPGRGQRAARAGQRRARGRGRRAVPLPRGHRPRAAVACGRAQHVRPDARGELGAPRRRRARRAAGRDAEQRGAAAAAAGRPAHDLAAAGGHARPRPRGARPRRGAGSRCSSGSASPIPTP